MSGRADHDRDDVDPTGIRHLLAGLPDPGPMPEDLVRRIEARLKVEHAAREHGPAHPLGRHADRVVDLATERGRRRPGRTLAWLGAAAAGLVVTATVVPQLVGGADSGGDSGTAAYYPTQGDADTSGSQEDGAEDGSAGGGENDPDEQPRSLSSADDEAADEEMADGRDGADPASPALPLLPLDGQLVLLTDLGPVQHEALTETLLQAVDEHDGTATTPARGPDLLTEAEATSCWRGLAETHSFDRYVAATAQVLLPDGRPQGDPMVALLGQHDDGSARSWVMPQECTDNPDTLPLLQGQPHG